MNVMLSISVMMSIVIVCFWWLVCIVCLVSYMNMLFDSSMIVLMVVSLIFGIFLGGYGVGYCDCR